MKHTLKTWLTTSVLGLALVATASAQMPAQTTPPAAPVQDAQAKAVAAVQGTWLIMSMNGQSLADAGVEMALVMTGNKYQQVTNGTVDETGTFTIDASKKPMTLDLKIETGDSAGQLQLGIAEIIGDTKQAVLAEPGVNSRPAGFSDPGAAIGVIAKRVK